MLVGAFKMHKVTDDLKNKWEDKNKQPFLSFCLQNVNNLIGIISITLANVYLDDGKEGLCVVL